MKSEELKSVYIDRTGDWVRSGNDTGKYYLKSEADKVIAGLERKVALLHRECINHKLETTHLRFMFWHSQREWWESEDRGDNKPLFDYAAREQSCVRLMCRLRKKLEADK